MNIQQKRGRYISNGNTYILATAAKDTRGTGWPTNNWRTEMEEGRGWWKKEAAESGCLARRSNNNAHVVGVNGA